MEGKCRERRESGGTVPVKISERRKKERGFSRNFAGVGKICPLLAFSETLWLIFIFI